MQHEQKITKQELKHLKVLCTHCCLIFCDAVVLTMTTHLPQWLDVLGYGLVRVARSP